MNFQKTVELRIDSSGKNFVAYDIATLSLLLATTAITGNYSLYGIKKKNNKYYVPMEKVKERITVIEERIRRWQTSLGIMKQIIGEKHNKKPKGDNGLFG